jgi:hypothetical protein
MRKGVMITTRGFQRREFLLLSLLCLLLLLLLLLLHFRTWFPDIFKNFFYCFVYSLFLDF